METINQILARELGREQSHIDNVIKLLDEGNTIPFIARYRKELHGAMDDTALRTLAERLEYLRSLQDRRDSVKKSNTAEGKMPEVTAEKTSLASDDANLSDVTNVKAALEKLAAKVWYAPITITSFTVSPSGGTFERGYTVKAPKLTWSTSKTPKKTTVNGVTLADPSQKTYTMPSDITASTTVTLTVTEQDAQGATAKEEVNYAFGYAIYAGMAADTATFTADWVRKTVGGKAVKTSAKGDYTMKGSTDKYWWLIVPTAWSVSFKTALGAGGAECAWPAPMGMSRWARACPLI